MGENMIEIADINFRLPIEVVYDEERRVVLGARLSLPTQSIDITSIFSRGDWAEILDSMKENGYLSYDSYYDMLSLIEGEER